MFETRDEALRCAATFVAPEHLEAVTDTLIPAIGVRPGEPDAPSHLGETRLGGRPDLPAGEVWPRPRGNDALPYAFIAQIDLAEAHALGAVAGDLPETGRLLFFYDTLLGVRGDADLAAAVVWDTTPVDELVTMDMPDDLAAAADHGTPGGEGYPPECFAAPRRPAQLFSSVTVPIHAADAPETRHLFVEGGFVDLVDGFDDFTDCDDCFVEPEWRHHQLLGIPVPEQYDPRFDVEGLTEDGAEADWRLLLQLSIPDWDQADLSEGSVYFLIRNDDLAVARFDRVQAIYQQT